MMTEEKIETWWIGIIRYINGIPQFTSQKISASTSENAMTQYDLLNIDCIEVVRFVDDNHLYFFDDE